MFEKVFLEIKKCISLSYRPFLPPIKNKNRYDQMEMGIPCLKKMLLKFRTR